MVWRSHYHVEWTSPSSRVALQQFGQTLYDKGMSNGRTVEYFWLPLNRASTVLLWSFPALLRKGTAARVVPIEAVVQRKGGADSPARRPPRSLSGQRGCYFGASRPSQFAQGSLTRSALPATVMGAAHTSVRSLVGLLDGRHRDRRPPFPRPLPASLPTRWPASAATAKRVSRSAGRCELPIQSQPCKPLPNVSISE